MRAPIIGDPVVYRRRDSCTLGVIAAATATAELDQVDLLVPEVVDADIVRSSVVRNVRRWTVPDQGDSWMFSDQPEGTWIWLFPGS